jgi:hypothetical protein
MAQERRLYTREYKMEAVRLVVEEERPLAQVARELGIGRHHHRILRHAVVHQVAERRDGGGIVHGDAEERLQLCAVRVHRHQVPGAGRLKRIRDQAGHDRLAPGANVVSGPRTGTCAVGIQHHPTRQPRSA